MKGTCDRLWEVDALREGRLVGEDAASSERHLATCAACRRQFEADEHLRELGMAIQFATMDDLRARRLRARVLRAVGEGPPSNRRFPLIVAVAALACALVAFVGWNRMHPKSAPVVAVSPPISPPLAGAVVPLHDSIWSQSREANTERIRLERGELRIRVRKQSATERFLVELPDGNIEVRGTQFDVRVDGAKTVSIVVSEGVVAFHPRGEAAVVLLAGQSWPSHASPVPSATTARLPLPSPKPEPIDTTADEYDLAVHAYHRHDYDDAAERFQRFSNAHPRAPQTEDAMFLHASALAYAGHDDAAATVAERFLAQYPASIHARDASELVARAARKNGE